MNAWLLRIDVALLRGYQWVVNTTQRELEWWAEQSAIAYAAAELLRFGFSARDGWDWLGVIVCGFLAMVLYMVATEEDGCERLSSGNGGSPWFRLALMFFPVFDVGLLMLNWSADAHDVVSCCGGLALASIYYFASCSPPTPPEPDMQPEGAGA
jgi:hypothetical protein